MRNVCVAAVCVILCLSLVAGPALASDKKCKQLDGQFTGSTYRTDCVFDGTTYPNCLDSGVTGNFNAAFTFYFPDDNVAEVPGTMPGHNGLATGWGLGRYVTPKGELWTSDSWVMDYLQYIAFDYSAFTQVSIIVGGTGIYTGATGEIFQSGSDAEGGDVSGEICQLR